MAHSQVAEIELRYDNSISLNIEIFGFDAGTLVEISGNATQANGAVATFYTVQELPLAGPDGGSFLTVLAVPSTSVPSAEFVPGEVITVIGRATKIWGTVLDGDPDVTGPWIKAAWKARPDQ